MRKFTIVFWMFLCVLKVGAQGVAVSPEEAAKKKEINDLKKSETIVYAEVYEPAANDEAALILAQRKSVDKLRASIVEAVVRETNMTKEDAAAIFDVIDDKCQNVVITSGDVRRIVAYVAKDAIGLTSKKPNGKDEAEYLGTDNDSIAMDKTVSQIMNGQDSINVATQQEANVLPKDTEVEEKVEEVKKDEGTPLVELLPAEKVTPVEEAAPAVEVVVPELCQKLIVAGSWNAMGKILKKEKARNKLMYGNSDQMQRHDRCYIVVAKLSGELVAVLDKGESDRVNFMSKRMDHFKNYQGQDYKIVFVQEY